MGGARGFQPLAALLDGVGRLQFAQRAPGPLAFVQRIAEFLRRGLKLVAQGGQLVHLVQRLFPRPLALGRARRGGKLVKLFLAALQRLVHALPAGHRLDLFPDRGHQVAPGLQGGILFGLRSGGQVGHALANPDQAGGAAHVVAQQVGDPRLGLVGLGDEPSVAMHGGRGLLQPALGDGEMSRVCLDLDRHLGCAARMGAQGHDLLVPGAVALEEQRAQAVEKGGLAVFVRLAQNVQPVADALQPGWPGEAAYVVQGDGTNLHLAASRT